MTMYKNYRNRNLPSSKMRHPDYTNHTPRFSAGDNFLSIDAVSSQDVFTPVLVLEDLSIFKSQKDKMMKASAATVGRVDNADL